MSARVLVVADPKMLPALASGLREGGRLEVATAASLDAAKELLAGPLNAVIVFYGTAEWTMPVALAALAPAREKGAQLIAVLQRGQAAMRDDCFRAGASDAFFMPIPKETFVGRLADVAGLLYAEEAGAPAAVQASSRTTAAPVEPATVTLAGVHGPATVPFAAGQTVRLSWKAGDEAFNAWGLIARSGAAGAQVRFAGLTPEEESRLRSWLKTAAAAAPADAAPKQATPPSGNAPARAGGIPTLTPVATAAVPAAEGTSATTATGATDSTSATTATGATESTSATAAPEEPRATVTAVPPPAAAKPLEHLFDETPAAGSAPIVAPASAPAEAAVAAAAPAPAPEEAALGALWPEPWPLDWCRAAVLALLRNKAVQPGPDGGAAVARRVTDRMPAAERERADPPLAMPGSPATPALDAAVARLAMAGAGHAGEKLLAARSPVLVDADSVMALTKLADAAGERLQQEANGAIAKGDTELLRQVSSSRSALSQELLGFKKMVDRLRGLGALPKLGPGSLDPEVQIGSRPPPRKQAQAAAAESSKKLEYPTSEDAQQRPRRTGLAVAVAAVLFAITAGNALWFGPFRINEVSGSQLERAGKGVMRISTATGKAAVAVAPAWLAHADANARALVQVLNELKIEKAMLTLPDGTAVGSLDARTGKILVVTPRKSAGSGAATPDAPATAQTPR